MIIAVTGTPGTGKTAVAKSFSRRYRYRLVDLNGLVLSRHLWTSTDPKRKSKVVDMRKLKAAVKKELEKGGNVVMEGHFSHDLPADIVFVLRTEPGTLRKRLLKKGWSAGKIEENLEAERMGVCLVEALDRHGAGRVVEIDTTHKKPAAVAGLMASHLRKGLRRVNAFKHDPIT